MGGELLGSVCEDAELLVELGKRIRFGFICHTTPMMEGGIVRATWVGKRGPFPFPDLLHAQPSFGLHVPTGAGGVRGE